MISFLGGIVCQVEDAFFEAWAPITLIVIVIVAVWEVIKDRRSATRLRKASKAIQRGLLVSAVGIVVYAVFVAPPKIHQKLQAAYEKLGVQKSEELSVLKTENQERGIVQST